MSSDSPTAAGSADEMKPEEARPENTPANLKKLTPPKFKAWPRRQRDLMQHDVPRGRLPDPSNFLEMTSPGPSTAHPPALTRREARELTEFTDPGAAAEARDRVFNDRLKHVQAASRRMQTHLVVNDTEPWPNPRVPDGDPDRQSIVIANNTDLLHDALDQCKDYAVDMSRQSSAKELLDPTILTKRKRGDKEPEEKKEAGKAKAPAFDTDDEKDEAVRGLLDVDMTGNARTPGAAPNYFVGGLLMPKKKANLCCQDWPECPHPTPPISMPTPEVGSAIPDLTHTTPDTTSTAHDSQDDPDDTGEERVYREAYESYQYQRDAERNQEMEDVGSAATYISDATTQTASNTTATSEHEVQSSADQVTDAQSVHSTAPLADDSADERHKNQKRKDKKPRNLPTPQPEGMAGTFTQAICSHETQFTVRPVLTLTLESVDPLLSAPRKARNVILHHFEVGLDGVESLVSGHVQVPETPEVTEEREKRLGPLGMYKRGAGGFYHALKKEQREKGLGQGIWLFWGVRFAKTRQEKKNRKSAKWMCFGVPLEASSRVELTDYQKKPTVMLGGGEDRDGYYVPKYKANGWRMGTQISKGGVAPMDIWKGGEDWEDGVFKDIGVAMANGGLSVVQIHERYGHETPRPTPKPSKKLAKPSVAGKKRKVATEMTEAEITEEQKEMAKSKKPSMGDVGKMMANMILGDRAEQAAAAEATEASRQKE